MKELALKLWRGEDVPIGVRVLTAATAIRWIGWGFAESLIPVFIFSFVHSYAQSGLLKASYDVAFILVIPIVGVLADRMRATTLIVIGLLMYIIVGSGYLLAGITGIAIFIVVARFFNGIGYALDAVGRETYFRRHVRVEKVATVFGYFDTISNFWWILAAIAGIWLVKIFALHWLFFMIVPTVIVSIVLVLRLRSRETDEIPTPERQKPRYRDLLQEVGGWHWKLKAIVGMNFFVSFAYAVVAFFVPIEMFSNGSGYTPIIIMGVVSTIPPLFGWVLGDLFDKKGVRVFGYGLFMFGGLLALLGFMDSYMWQIGIVFAMGIVIELLSVGSNELVTVYSNPDHFGRVDGMMRSITNIGSMVGPLALGIVLDNYGAGLTYSILAFIIFGLTAAFMAVMHIAHRQKINK